MGRHDLATTVTHRPSPLRVADQAFQSTYKALDVPRLDELNTISQGLELLWAALSLTANNRLPTVQRLEIYESKCLLPTRQHEDVASGEEWPHF